jgi:hypothetical protein
MAVEFMISDCKSSLRKREIYNGRLVDSSPDVPVKRTYYTVTQGLPYGEKCPYTGYDNGGKCLECKAKHSRCAEVYHGDPDPLLVAYRKRIKDMT